MDNVSIYNNTRELKSLINILTSNSPENLKFYIDTKAAIAASLSSAANEVGSIINENLILNWLREEKIKIPSGSSTLNHELLRLYNMYAEDLPSRQPLTYTNYNQGWITCLALDLALLQKVTSFNRRPNYKEVMETASALSFQKSARMHQDRIKYTSHFVKSEEDRKPRKLGTYQPTWSLPIRKSWYNKVYKKNLDLTDIAGKKVFVLNAEG